MAFVTKADKHTAYQLFLFLHFYKKREKYFI